MNPSCSPPPQSPPMIPLASPSQSAKTQQYPENNVAQESSPTRVPITPVSSRQPPAPPTPPDSSSRNNSMNINTSLSPLQSKHQSLSPSQNMSSSISPRSSLASHSSPVNMPSLSSNLVNMSSLLSENGIVQSSAFNSTAHTSIPSFSGPNSAAFEFAYDHMFPESSDSQPSLSPDSLSQALPGSSRSSQPTPNIYINGLPPHFPEQELFALARPFGEVKSVRSFTRHVSDKPTGYGFVLYGDIESAERCIEGLRKYRNLHPSFSKQIHRIPGTSYAQNGAPLPPDFQDEDSFKARMEKLRDESSTNLYIEGLPLSIDEDSLTALMLPHTIKSSRFFKTKLSDPPRIIAFVRLETRSAAEDTIERLHGRMVRGWNDPGCRISVRFADTAEQRELRRTERSTKSDGDQSPARLTIAQAALLNLRGQDLHANARKPLSIQRNRDFQTTSFDSTFTDPQYPSPDIIAAARMLSNASVLSNRGMTYPDVQAALLSLQDLQLNPEMNALLQSLQQNLDFSNASTSNSVNMSALESEYRLAQQAHLNVLANANGLSPNLDLPLSLPRGQTQARNGFTPAEELILQAHARLQHQQQQQQLQFHRQASSLFEGDPFALRHPSPLIDTAGVNGRSKLNAAAPCFDVTSAYSNQRPCAQLGGRGQGVSARSKFSRETLPSISEDDFHSMAQHQIDATPQYRVSQGQHDLSVDTNIRMTKPPSRAVEIVPPSASRNLLSGAHLQQNRLQTNTSNSAYPKSALQNHQHAHLRSSTLPPSPLANNQHNIQHISNSTRSNSFSNPSNNTDTSNDHTKPYIYSGNEHSKNNISNNYPSMQSNARGYAQALSSLEDSRTAFDREQAISPSLISPALTYSSRSPSTLSPSTPFMGSFNNGHNGFESMSGEGDLNTKNHKVRLGTQ
ncbi:hypothetical protein BJ138DRAFT_1112176 [Hygrophoropsis aurantiaca]|uniref:Uncharacterized protein n=1 Tax=Hygrophoropsis aurantiaca TaxID=72124 RepID=A0ACB8AI15_9AGAM|nr:hypothetical protein BJ138DRAFT_1112176 [Hygrophoropsis aurantiaca]